MLSRLRRLWNKKLTKHFLKTFAVAALGVAILGALWLYLVFKDLPSPELLQNHEVSQSTKIYDREGKTLLYEVYAEEKRTIIPDEEIPQDVKEATIAIEDQDFYNHPAFALKAFFRAAVANLVHGWGSQGGSTITQQLAKNLFLSNEKTITRKIKELVLAFRLERQFTKDQILYLYLNQIPYGSSAYGIESAAQTFFQKPAKDLTLAESALLAALPQAPSYYSPYGKHLTELLARKNLVLQKMYELGYITDEEKKKAQTEELRFEKSAHSIRAPHFSLAVADYLKEKYGDEAVRNNGLKVTTTLDWKLQEVAEKVVAEGAKRNEELYKGTNAALVAEDTTTGGILALVGSRDYFDENIGGAFSVATQGLRQPGSALKPFVYLTAFEKGYTPETILFDLETEFDTTKKPENSYKPQNYDHIFRGPVSMRNSLAQSINVPAVKTLYLVGMKNMLHTMQLFGVDSLTDPSRYGLSLVLGGGEVKLIQMVGAYSTLSQEGVFRGQHYIQKVVDAQGNVLEEWKDEPTTVFEAQYARQINDILSDVNARAPLFVSSLDKTVFPGHDVALKTGTTDDYRDAWAFGYTPSLAVGVWAGNNNNQPMQRSGGSILAAVPIWNAFLVEALKDRSPEAFTSPDPVFVDKPMLNGQYVATTQNTEEGTQIASTVHDILYYVDRSDPTGPLPAHPERDSQFRNWEEAVAAWASTQTFSPNPELAEGVTILEPTPESEAVSPLHVRAEIRLKNPISKIQLYFNDALVDSVRLRRTSRDYSYDVTITPSTIQSRNFLNLVVTDEDDNIVTQEVILSGR